MHNSYTIKTNTPQMVIIKSNVWWSENLNGLLPVMLFILLFMIYLAEVLQMTAILGSEFSSLVHKNSLEND